MIKLLVFALLICLFVVVGFLLFLYRKYKEMSNDFILLKKVIQKLRYGDINLHIDNMHNKELQNQINRLIETIFDRETMIREYQTTLSKKNISLEEIIKQEKELRQVKEEFAATLTHDMKVPVIAELNSISYFLEERFGSINDKQKEVLKLMQSSVNELKTLIENILETYKLEQKGLNLNIKPNNLNEFIISIINEMYPIILNTEHNIINDIENTNNLSCEFDEFQIKRIIKNLIQNAITFSQNKTDIKVKTMKTQDSVKIIVSNKGNNISKEDLKMIFQKYYSGQSKFRKAGTGLGLYISEQIALAHNGNIDVETTNEGDTNFILTLPLNIAV